MDKKFCGAVAAEQKRKAAELAEASTTRELSLPSVVKEVTNFLINREDKASLDPPKLSIRVRCKPWHKTIPQEVTYEGWYIGEGPITCHGESHILLTRDGEVKFFRPHYFGNRHSLVKGNTDEAYFSISAFAKRIFNN